MLLRGQAMTYSPSHRYSLYQQADEQRVLEEVTKILEQHYVRSKAFTHA